MSPRQQRHTVARHGRLSVPRLRREVLALVAVAVAVVLVAGVGVATSIGYFLVQEVQENAVELDEQVEQPPSLGAYSGPFSMLLVGTDECEDELKAAMGARCEGPDAEGTRNDVNLLVHVGDAPRRVTVVSFPRDTMLGVPECDSAAGGTIAATSYAQINTVYERGGLACMARTVEQLTGLAVEFAAKVSFGGVVNITDAIGGVEVCIGNGGIRDPYTGIDWPAGTRTVEGLDALQFLRTRHGVGDESDLARIGNQQQYMASLSRKLTSSEVLADPAALLRLATAGVENIEASQSLADPLRIVQLALAAKDVPLDEITFVQYPVVADANDANRVAPDYSAGAILFEAIAANQPLEITGDASTNGGVIEATPEAGDESSDDASGQGEASADPESSATPDAAVSLPPNATGSTAAEETCSAGNVAG